jgi:ABC-2 type transport system permease protein
MLLTLTWAFTGAVYTGGHGIATELSKYPIVVYDLAQSPASRELVSRFRPPYFKLVGYAWSDAEVVAALDRGRANLAVVIPPTSSGAPARAGHDSRSSPTARSR